MPNSKQNYVLTHETFVFLKIWGIILCVLWVFYFFFNIVSLHRLERGVVEDYKGIYSISRRFSSYYNNVDSIFFTLFEENPFG